MLQHRFNVRSYARARAASDLDFTRHLAASEALISRLCDRYQIRGKSILSLGSGDGAREYWMTPANRVTMVGLGSPAPADDSDGVPADRYVTGDIGTFVRSCRETFDVLFVSGTASLELSTATGDATGDPLLRTVMTALPLVKQCGLVILQHSPFGIDADPGDLYFNRLADQFDRHGVRLAEAYHLRKSAQRVLVTATKSDIAGRTMLLQQLAGRPPITTLQGSRTGEPSRDIVQIDLLEFMSPRRFELRRLMDALRPQRQRAAAA